MLRFLVQRVVVYLWKKPNKLLLRLFKTVMMNLSLKKSIQHFVAI